MRTLALVPDHPAKNVCERRADHKGREHLDEIRQRGRVLKGIEAFDIDPEVSRRLRGSTRKAANE
jgi:hypothetical protein